MAYKNVFTSCVREMTEARKLGLVHAWPLHAEMKDEHDAASNGAGCLTNKHLRNGGAKTQ